VARSGEVAGGPNELTRRRAPDLNFKGVLPVGGARAFPMGKDAEGFFQVEVTHADFAHSLFLKTNDKTDVEDWMQVLEDCRKATYSNAVLGSALLDRLKSVGTTVEKEKQQALEVLQRQAEELEQARDTKWRTMMEHMQAQQTHDNAVNSRWGEQQRLQEEMDEIARNEDAEVASDVARAMLTITKFFEDPASVAP